MLKIFSQEAEVVINLVNVNVENEDQWFDMFFESFNESEKDIICDLSFEGDIVREDDNIEGIEYKEMTLEKYVGDLKEFCLTCLNDNENIE